jgi:3-oxoacyl-[acyl-carrier-protein] synthase-3
MLDSLLTKMKIPKEKAPTFMQDIGNTVSATIPIVLREHAQSFKAGNRMVLIGFGVGYSWAACLIEWGPLR